MIKKMVQNMSASVFGRGFMNDKDSKKIIGTVLTLAIIASFSPETVKSIEAKQILTNKSLIEHTYVDGYSDGNSFLERAILENDPSKIQIIKLNCTFETPATKTALTKLNDKRVSSLYNQEYFPQIIPDGVYDKTKFADKWGEQIKEAVAKQKQFIEFAVTPIDKSNNNINIILETKGILPEINRKKLNLGIMVYHDWKSVNITDDTGRTITTQRYLINSYPNGPIGSPVSIEYGKSIKQSITFSNISNTDSNMMGAIFYAMDMTTNKIISAAQYRFAKEQSPAYFNWNNWPKNMYALSEEEEKKCYKQTGLGEMKFSVTNAKDLKYLSFEIAKNANEKQMYEILTAKLGENINVDKYEYNKDTRKVSVTFKNPLNGDFELFSYITKFLKSDLTYSSSYKVKNFIALNSKNESVFYDINDIKKYCPVQLLIDIHPCDFNGDAKIDERNDLALLLKRFGTRLGDKDYQEKYNIVNTGFSKDRVDIADICKFNLELNKQEKLQKIVDEANKKTNSQTELRKEKVAEWQKFEARKKQKECDSTGSSHPTILFTWKNLRL